jgi:hypothetical protein
VKKFTVKRKTWLRGEGSTKSALLREKDQKMCCLGFYSLATGYKPEEIAGVADPESLFNRPEYLDGMESPDESWDNLVEAEQDGERRVQCTNVAQDLMKVNDHQILHPYEDEYNELYLVSQAEHITIDSEEKREEVLTALFKDADIEVSFVN